MNAQLSAMSNEKKIICTRLWPYIHIYIYISFTNVHSCIAMTVEWTKLK